MVNGNYVLYGDRPASESEIVDDHVHPRTVDRRNKRKANRTANELQRTLNLAQLDNETDSVKYEKKIKEPRLLRYVPTTDVEENFVTEKFETYDLKPTEERPRRYAFTKKPKNPTDGSVNYAYSRSSSSCSSPNGNLPTISEHGEQYGTYRVRSVPSPTVDDLISGYESKLDKYFTKPRDVKPFAAKGSHPDSLYRVAADSGAGAGKMVRVLRVLRWPVALLAVCVALAAFVYFLMPDNMESSSDKLKATFFEPVAVGVPSHSSNQTKAGAEPVQHQEKKIDDSRGTKTSEIDFYDTENDENYDLTPIIGSVSETSPQRKLPIPPVFPTHIAPEVQYGNERADTEVLRTPKILDKANTLSEDSTLKPHITQKPEKPLAIYFTEDSDATSSTTSSTSSFTTSSTTESITRAETVNDFTNYDEKQTTRKVEDSLVKNHPSAYKEFVAPVAIEAPSFRDETRTNIKQLGAEPELPPEIQEYYGRRPSEPMFTSGHSKLFGISIEDAEKMKSTTQSSLYNTRVSPTLPTWRDGDDTTTKKYPTNVYTEVPQCDSTRLALCRGVLPYDLAGSAAVIGGVQITSLMPQIEYLVATNCSDRVRHFVCALLEPECSPPPYPPKMPCYNLCKAIIDNCDGMIPRELTPAFNCQQYARSNCVAAKAPCYQREFTCGDGSCVPRDWICDGTKDCSNGEDEVSCVQCDKNEFRCRSGGCILKRWLCDGYADCPDGEDEDHDGCGTRDEHVTGEGRGELGEESAGSAPAPAIRRPNKVHKGHHRNSDLLRTGENDSSKELLVTSDSNNGFKRNFTRRPSPARLTPYSRPVPRVPVEKIDKEEPKEPMKKPDKKVPQENQRVTPKSILEHESIEDVNLGDLGFFDEFEKEGKEQKDPKKQWFGVAPSPAQAGAAPPPPPVRLDKNAKNFDRVIDGAALLQKAAKQIADDEKDDSREKNSTLVDKEDFPVARDGSISAHASPCPSGELRCVDGRCITLAQLCDGTIDCSDHADEDNCYT